MVATSRPAGRAAVSVMALMHAGQGQQEALNTLSLENRRPVLRRPATSGPGGCHVAFRSHALPMPESGLSLPCSKVTG